jgi:LPS-assembly protein
VRRVALLALAALLLLPARAGAAAGVPGLGSLRGAAGGGVTVDAESISYDQQSNVITARGAVKITRGEMVLTADTVRVNRSTQVAEAEGNVVVTDPEGTLTAEVMTLNLVEETGNLANGSVVLEKNHYLLAGRSFEKLPGQSYRVTGASFTTCLCGPGTAPDWSVRGERITLDLEGSGRVEKGVFTVKDVPVFYIPYGIFPLRRERQTGLLFPRFGVSNRRGFQIDQPFYVDISKSMDATLSFDLETSARIGTLLEYRYALSRDTLGEAYGAYFNEQIRGSTSGEVVNAHIADPNVPINRWSAGLTHDQWLPGDVKGFADVLRVSDNLLLRDINVFTFDPGVDVALRTLRFDRSRVGVERLFDRGMVMATSIWYQDFINPQRFAFQTPPRVETLGSWRFLDDRVALHVAGEGVNFERDSGFAGQRLDLRPEIEVPWRLQPWAYGSWRGGLRETVYTLNDTAVPTQVNVNPADPGSKPPSILPALDADANRELFYLGGEAGTQLARVVPFQRFGIVALKHTIEPTATYLFVPRSDTRQAALPLFDDVDRVNQRSVFTYGATSRLLARMAGPGDAAHAGGASGDSALALGSAGGSAPGSPGGDAPGSSGGAALGAARRGPIRELGRFSMFQSYDLLHKGGDFIDEVDPVTHVAVPRGGDRVSDLALDLHLTPASFLSLEGRTDYQVTSGRMKGANIGLVLTDPHTPSDDSKLEALRGRSRLAFGYRFVANSGVEEVNWSALFRLSKRFYGAYEARYDNLSKRFLENRYGLRLISDCECWVVDVGVSNRVNPQETQVQFLVTLVGLGQLGQEPFRHSFGATAPRTGRLVGQ